MEDLLTGPIAVAYRRSSDPKSRHRQGTFVAIPARSFKPAPPFAPKPKPSSG
jgi:hypothetical protein